MSLGKSNRIIPSILWLVFTCICVARRSWKMRLSHALIARQVEVKRAEPRDESNNTTPQTSSNVSLASTCNSFTTTFSPGIVSQPNSRTNFQPLTAQLLEPMALSSGWASSTASLTSFPWMSKPQFVATFPAFVTSTSGIVPIMPSVHDLFNGPILGAGLSCARDERFDSRFSDSTLFPGSQGHCDDGYLNGTLVPRLSSGLSLASRAMTPALMLSPQSMPSFPTNPPVGYTGVANTPATNNTIPGLSYKCRNQGFHPYRRS